MAERVAVQILTHNSRRYLPACLSGIRRQERRPDRILFIDCASTDGTVEWLKVQERADPCLELLLLEENRGYSGGHNAGLATCEEEFVQLLNPDVCLEPAFLAVALETMSRHPKAGSVTGKLLRADPDLNLLPGPILDSTGIVMTRSQRHLDRGAGEADKDQYPHEEEVFGASGAAPLYRRAMLRDIALRGEIFDEIFFAYREDADLAWRARLLGWSAYYTPAACAAHRRRVRPENRRSLPPEINRYSVRNRFLLRIKNQTASNLRHTLFPALLRDLQVIGYVLIREPASVPGLLEVFCTLRRTLAKRRLIMSRRSASAWEVDRWFGPVPTR